MFSDGRWRLIFTMSAFKILNFGRNGPDGQADLGGPSRLIINVPHMLLSRPHLV